MVGMRVRDGEGVEAADGARPQVRRHNVFADIQIRMRPARQASRIHQQGTAAGGHQQNRVSLAYINGCHLEHRGPNLRTRRDG